jgi:hypothetical protein
MVHYISNFSFVCLAVSLKESSQRPTSLFYHQQTRFLLLPLFEVAAQCCSENGIFLVKCHPLSPSTRVIRGILIHTLSSTEYHDQVVITPASYLGGPGIKSRPRDKLS